MLAVAVLLNYVAWAFIVSAAMSIVGALAWGLIVQRIEQIEWPAASTPPGDVAAAAAS